MALAVVVIGVALGVTVSLPAIVHFIHTIEQSDRDAGLSVETVLSGSLPSYSLMNLLYPIWKMRWSEPTMERFHLLFITVPLAGYALWRSVKDDGNKSRILYWFSIGTFCTFLALGKNDPFGLRQFLAEHFFLYRIGRFPAGEHRGAALFMLALISAVGLDLFLFHHKRYKRVLVLILSLDFLLVMYGLKYMRVGKPPETYRGEVAVFQVSLGPADQRFLDAPRNCTPDGDNWAIPGLQEQRDLPPYSFFWSGYAPPVTKSYLDAKEDNIDILCGPSRLWTADTRTPVTYSLETYDPGRIKFKIVDNSIAINSPLVWAEYNDGFWKLFINEQESEFDTFPAGLRAFHANTGDTVEMIYAGPLSRWWRLGVF